MFDSGRSVRKALRLNAPKLSCHAILNSLLFSRSVYNLSLTVMENLQVNFVQC